MVQGSHFHCVGVEYGGGDCKGLSNCFSMPISTCLDR